MASLAAYVFLHKRTLQGIAQICILYLEITRRIHRVCDRSNPVHENERCHIASFYVLPL